MNKMIQEWLNYAEYDKTAMLQLNQFSYKKQVNIICYLAQQYAEKSLKALMLKVLPQEKLLNTHDLHFLLKKISSVLAIPDELVEYSSVLTPYAVNARYPYGETLDEVDVRLAIKYSEAIHQFCVKEIGD